MKIQMTSAVLAFSLVAQVGAADERQFLEFLKTERAVCEPSQQVEVNGVLFCQSELDSLATDPYINSKEFLNDYLDYLKRTTANDKGEVCDASDERECSPLAAYIDDEELKGSCKVRAKNRWTGEIVLSDEVPVQLWRLSYIYGALISVRCQGINCPNGCKSEDFKRGEFDKVRCVCKN